MALRILAREDALQEARAERDYLRTALGVALTNQQKLLESPPRRRCRWPWERRGEI